MPFTSESPTSIWKTTISRHKHVAAYSAALILMAAVSLKLWIAAYSLALDSDRYSHVFFALPMSLLLIWWKWGEVRPVLRFQPAWAALPACLAVLPAALALGGSTASGSDTQLIAGMSAVVLLWWSASLLCLGGAASKRLAVPLLLLVALIPVPEAAMSWLLTGLRLGSAWSAEMMFKLSFVPVFRDGFVLAVPGVTVDVAPECSSIRSSTLLVLTAIVLAEILLSSGWKKLVVVVASAPLAVLKNGFRIYLLTLLTAKVDPDVLNSKWHHQGGPLFLGIALAALGGLLWVLRRAEVREQARKQEAGC